MMQKMTGVDPFGFTPNERPAQNFWVILSFVNWPDEGADL